MQYKSISAWLFEEPFLIFFIHRVAHNYNNLQKKHVNIVYPVCEVAGRNSEASYVCFSFCSAMLGRIADHMLRFRFQNITGCSARRHRAVCSLGWCRRMLENIDPKAEAFTEFFLGLGCFTIPISRRLILVLSILLFIHYQWQVPMVFFFF